MAWRKESKLVKALKYVAVIVVVLVMLVPYLFTVVASLAGAGAHR